MISSKQEKVMWGRMTALLKPYLSWREKSKIKTLQSKFGVSYRTVFRWMKGVVPRYGTMKKLSERLGLDWEYIRDGVAGAVPVHPLGLSFRQDRFREAKTSAMRYDAFIDTVVDCHRFLRTSISFTELHCRCHTENPTADILIPISREWTFRFHFFVKDRICVELFLDTAGMAREHFSGEVSEFALASGIRAIRHHAKMHDLTNRKVAGWIKTRNDTIPFLDKHNGI